MTRHKGDGPVPDDAIAAADARLKEASMPRWRADGSLQHEAAAYRVTFQCVLPRPWSCDGCSDLLRKGESARVQIVAGTERNRVFHLMCIDPKTAEGV